MVNIDTEDIRWWLDYAIERMASKDDTTLEEGTMYLKRTDSGIAITLEWYYIPEEYDGDVSDVGVLRKKKQGNLRYTLDVNLRVIGIDGISPSYWTELGEVFGEEDFKFPYMIRPEDIGNYCKDIANDIGTAIERYEKQKEGRTAKIIPFTFNRD